MGLEDHLIAGVSEYRSGFAWMDWGRLGKLIRTEHARNEWHAIYSQVARHWVERLRQSLGGSYQAMEQGEFLLLSCRPQQEMNELLHWAGEAKGAILDNLEGAGWERELYGQYVILDFEEEDDYEDYIHAVNGFCHRSLRSGGFCLRSGYVHVAINCGTMRMARAILCHELTHNLLSHLTLPAWVDEGIAGVMEVSVARSPLVGQIELGLLLDGLRRNGVAPLWTGQGFVGSNTEAQLWRTLAIDLVRTINAVDPTRFAEFLRTAKPDDAGKSACRAVYGRTPGSFLSDLIGPGNWESKDNGLVQPVSWRWHCFLRKERWQKRPWITRPST